MKKLFKTLPLVLIMMSIYSCTSDDETVQDVNDNSSVVTTFTCTQENDGTTTKAALGSEGKILWESGDAISIFDGAGNKQFTLKAESDGQKSGSFTGECNESESYVAVYPYTAGATLSYDRKSVSNIVLPDEQNAVAGGFDPKAALMIAKSKTTTLQFKNAVGFIKVTPKFDCKKIILRAANKTQPLAGKGTIKFDGSDPYIDFTGSKELSYSITLSGTITSENAYYIAVPAVTLSACWTLTFVTENKNYMRQVRKPITFVRSIALNLGTFATDGDYWVGSNGIVTSDKQVNLGLTIEQGGKTYKVYFAKSNLTTTGLAENESDYGDYFAWGAIKPWYSSIDKSKSPWTATWEKTGGYTEANAPYYNNGSYTKYTIDGEILEAADDAANVILGGDWWIPTKAIWEALVNNSPEHLDSGYNFTNNGQTLFLPAAGYVNGTSFYANSDGYYWSGTANPSTDAYYLQLYSSGNVSAKQVCDRYCGFSVRPVRLVAVSAATTTEGYNNEEKDFEW
ncbi:MAG: hypothetical protein SO375_03120 [Prevotella sp.]|nr:hypothetical protein [Prevotella sp.]